MSEKVMKDLYHFISDDSSKHSEKPTKLVQHPLYDNFGERISKGEAREYLGLNNDDKIILFFGFIRRYKGLDLLIQAMNDESIKRNNIKLLIAGEFYEDERLYLQLVKQYQLQDHIILRDNFIPDHEVKYYLCAADVVVQPYRNATQSGVTPLAYHFEVPMIVTNVGGLPALVPHEKAGLVCNPEPQDIADAILKFYQLGADHFLPHIRSEKQKYSWNNLVQAIIDLHEEVKL
jgi:glycosyltransferase involved in cell wall biosynthesis